MVNDKRLITEFCNLVKVTSRTRKERELADIIKGRLSDLGLDVYEDDTAGKISGSNGNIFGYLRGNTKNVPVLMFGAHMDSVDPCNEIKPRIQTDMITSDGNTVLGADDKSGIVVILEALRILTEKDVPHGDIQVVFTAAEEGGLNGSGQINKEQMKADFGYILDSSGHPGKVVISAPGLNKVRVIIHGKSSHAGSAPERGINAITAAGKAIARIKQGRIDEETTANVGSIQGGGATNIVPDFVEILCEVRSRNLSKLSEQTRDMAETFRKVAAEEGAKVEIEIKSQYLPYTLDKNMPGIAIAEKAAKNIDLPLSLEATGGGSDANSFNRMGLPTVVLATGMSEVHTTREYIRISDLKKIAEFVLAVIAVNAGQSRI